MSNSKKHWEDVYNENAPDEVSWYQLASEKSVHFIERTGSNKEDWIIDVGAGASILVDQLLERGYRKIALLDVSSKALSYTKKRLGDRVDQIEWIESDIKEFQPKHKFNVWHDRAVFHFLTEPQDRRSYINTLKSSLLPGGHVVIATFAVGGPKQCSGLDIVQYNPEKLSQELGDSFELLESLAESHRTPWGTEQKFIYCHFRNK